MCWICHFLAFKLEQHASQTELPVWMEGLWVPRSERREEGEVGIHQKLRGTRMWRQAVPLTGWWSLVAWQQVPITGSQRPRNPCIDEKKSVYSVKTSCFQLAKTVGVDLHHASHSLIYTKATGCNNQSTGKPNKINWDNFYINKWSSKQLMLRSREYKQMEKEKKEKEHFCTLCWQCAGIQLLSFAHFPMQIYC